MGKTKTEDRLLMIVDGSNLAHRAFHKFRNLSYKGEPTGLMYGFLRILQSYIIRFRPTYVLVTFDTHQRLVHWDCLQAWLLAKTAQNPRG